MENPVLLESIIEEMEMQSAESGSYLNKKTGEIIGISEEELRAEKSHPHQKAWEESHQLVSRRVRSFTTASRKRQGKITTAIRGYPTFGVV